MSQQELNAASTMKLLLLEALSDRRIDDEEKRKILALSERLGIKKSDVEDMLRESASNKEVTSANPRPFDAHALFKSACELALQDGVLTEEERRNLFTLKEVLDIQDDWYSEQMQQLTKRCNQVTEDLDDATISANDLAGFEPAPLIASIIANIEKIIVGKTEVIRQILTAALANSHALLEDVPGTGKTMLARAMAASVDCTFKRVQFTPDLLPMDVTGTMIYNPSNSTFSFKRGPIFTNIFLADEINRATPRTQSSLLEVMEERQVSVDGAAFTIPPVFFVLATQNPVEQHGTYPLPEAQLDRFLLKLNMGYPERQQEREMLISHLHGNPINSIKPVVSRRQFRLIQFFIREKVLVSPEILDYILALADTLRHHQDLVLGPSPRASIALMNAVRAWAVISGRNFVTPDDVKKLAGPVFAHRLILQPQAMVKRIPAGKIVEDVISSVPVPVVKTR